MFSAYARRTGRKLICGLLKRSSHNHADGKSGHNKLSHSLQLAPELLRLMRTDLTFTIQFTVQSILPCSSNAIRFGRVVE